MRCTERLLVMAALALLAGCAPGPTAGPGEAPPAPAASDPQVAASAAAVAAPPAEPAGPARDWDEYRRRAAERIVAANPGATFDGPMPLQLRSIPVLTVHVRQDGSVRQITVLRAPKSSPQTVQMAMAAVRKAAPFEPVGRLRAPWQFNETFLYNDQLKFQLRSLDVAP